MKNLILELDLVPKSSWLNNVRAILTEDQWDLIRSQVYSKAYSLCQICGGVGPKHPVEAHEIWSYDDKSLIQKLEGIIALCPNCHSVKHFGLAQVLGKADKALKHLMKVNEISKNQAEKHIVNSFEVWAKRSLKEWKLDISHLLEYGINLDNIKR